MVTHSPSRPRAPDDDDTRMEPLAESSFTVQMQSAASSLDLAQEQSSPSWRHEANLLFNDPSSSRAASILSGFILFIIVVSTVTFILESVPSLSDDPEYGTAKNRRVWFSIETVIISIFSAELLIRWVVDDRPSTFMCRVPNIIDAVAIIPYFIEFFLRSGDVDLRFLRAVRLTRVFRVLKLGKTFGGTEVLLRVIVRSFQALMVPFFFLLIGVVIFASLAYLMEQGDYDPTTKHFYVRDDITGARVRSKFVSIPDAMWWALVTMTTVGYGDFVPVTKLGKATGTLCMMFGVVFMAMPIAIIGQNFVMLWGEHSQSHSQLRGQVEQLTILHSDDIRLMPPADVIVTMSTMTLEGDPVGVIRLDGTCQCEVLQRLPLRINWMCGEGVRSCKAVVGVPKDSRTDDLHYVLMNVGATIVKGLRRDYRLAAMGTGNAASGGLPCYYLEQKDVPSSPHHSPPPGSPCPEAQ